MNKQFCYKDKILILILSILLIPNILAQTPQKTYPITKFSPQITTNKSNYQHQETVQIEGVNFQSFERVSLNFKYFDENLQQFILLNRTDIYADIKGYLLTDWEIQNVYQNSDRFIIEAKGNISGLSTTTEISTLAPTATSVKIEQCANSNVSPQNLDCPNGGPTGWVTGIVGSSKAMHFEGDSIAYRNVMEDLIVGNSYKWTVNYDTSKGGVNAIDYLTTFNRTITNANPCQDGATVNGFCTAGAADSTFPIPSDVNVTNGRDQITATSDDISQVAGHISAWGATITAVSAPTYTGTFPGGDSTASVDITFTANNATAVLAWGGHISTRSDWGQTFGSINISGAPYHTSNGGLMNLTNSSTCCGGSQDLQLQASAVTASAKIIIIKHATPPSTFMFGFSTINLSPSTFTLVDNSLVTDPMQVFDNITTFDVKRITETNFGSYTLQSIVCTVDIGTGGTPTPVRTGNSIDIDIKSGDVVTCTFNNNFVTAAAVSIGGRILNTSGIGVSRASVSMTDVNGNIRTAVTNNFGYYRFNNVGAGETYFFNIRHKQYAFTSELITINEGLNNLNFFASQ